MVTTNPDARSYVSEHSAATRQLDHLRTTWLVEYRQKHPEANCWAEGFSPIEHRVQTQERVFRMAEQLLARGISRRSLFATLREADAVALGSAGTLPARAPRARHLYIQGRTVRNQDFHEEPWRSSLPAAIAGCEVIDELLGDRGAVINLLPRQAFEQQLGHAGPRWFPRPQAGRVIILIDEAPPAEQVQACGFDPIYFDGTDPAAFAWAIFELASRAEAESNQMKCECHSGSRSVPVGVAVGGRAGSLTNLARLTMAERTPAYAER